MAGKRKRSDMVDSNEFGTNSSDFENSDNSPNDNSDLSFWEGDSSAEYSNGSSEDLSCSEFDANDSMFNDSNSEEEICSIERSKTSEKDEDSEEGSNSGEEEEDSEEGDSSDDEENKTPLFPPNISRRPMYHSLMSRKDRYNEGLFTVLLVLAMIRKIGIALNESKLLVVAALIFYVLPNLKKQRRVRQLGDNIMLQDSALNLNEIGANFYFRFNWTELKKIDKVFKSKFKLNLANVYTNRYVSTNSVEVIALVCYKLAYPHRVNEGASFFNTSPSRFSTIFLDALAAISSRFHLLLANLNTVFIKRYLKKYIAVLNKYSEGSIPCSWGLLDGTHFDVLRPSFVTNAVRNIIYSGKEKTFCLKYLGACTPDGIMVMFNGPHEGSSHDSGCVNKERLLHTLRSIRTDEGLIVGVIADAGFAFTEVTTVPFRRTTVASDFQWLRRDFNQLLSSVNSSFRV